jgi:hypothetical protein
LQTVAVLELGDTYFANALNFVTSQVSGVVNGCNVDMAVMFV